MDLNPIVSIRCFFSHDLDKLRVYVKRYNDIRHEKINVFDISSDKANSLIFSAVDNGYLALNSFASYFSDIEGIIDFCNICVYCDIFRSYKRGQRKRPEWRISFYLTSHQIGGITQRINRHLKELNNYTPPSSLIDRRKNA